MPGFSQKPLTSALPSSPHFVLNSTLSPYLEDLVASPRVLTQRYTPFLKHPYITKDALS